MWFYLSFAENKKWNGAVVVEAESVKEAASKAWQLGINPGGEVLAFEILEGIDQIFPPKKRNRLLSKDDIPNPKRIGDMGPEEREEFEKSIKHDCGH